MNDFVRPKAIFLHHEARVARRCDRDLLDVYVWQTGWAHVEARNFPSDSGAMQIKNCTTVEHPFKRVKDSGTIWREKACQVLSSYRLNCGPQLFPSQQSDFVERLISTSGVIRMIKVLGLLG